MERDETPENGPQSTLDTIVSTPAARSSIAARDPPSQFTFSVKTPSTAGRPQPDHEEMHPSKAQQSTMKMPDSGLRLGFTSANNSPRVNAGSLVTNTPSKVKSGLPNNMSSPEFKFTRPESHLSEEAQRLMEGLQEEATKIKEQMALQREEQVRKDGEAEEMFSAVGRKIAKPKGRAGRFSDVHMAEFKKMDSIAGHASAYRSKPVQVQPPAKSLKRTQSRAGLDEADKQVTAPKKAQPYQPPTPAINISGPPKRIRQAQSDDASTSRPSTSDGTSLFKSNLPRSQSGLMTPTKASLARSASVRSLKTTNIPALESSPSTKTIAAPSTVGASRYKSFLPTAAANLKSILRRHQPRFSNDPVKIAAGTHLASPDLNKDLPAAPKSDFDEFNPPSSTKKHVGFTPSTKNRHSIMPGALPSPGRETGRDSGSATQPSITYPTLPDTASSSPFKSPGGNRIFAKMASPTIRRVRPSNIGTETMTSDAGTSFTFTGFSPSPQRLLNTGNRGHSLAEFPSVPQGILNTGHRGHSLADFPSVPHGMPNKKRRRQSNEENEETRREPEPSDEPNLKRVKRAVTAEPTPMQIPAAKSRIPRREAAGNRPKGKSILSLSRLNMLARPKERK
jgi:hypothetical protein